jgi:hypothetical protein
MDSLEYFIYWLVFAPLAAMVVVMGVITLSLIGIVVLWQWCFEERKESDDHQLRTLREGDPLERRLLLKG